MAKPKKKAEAEDELLPEEPELVPEDKLNQAYENIKTIRRIVRDLHRQVFEIPMSGTLKQARKTTDYYVEVVCDPMLTNALKYERQVAETSSSSPIPMSLKDGIEDLYGLAQRVPSYKELPEGEADNQIRSIQALMKLNQNATEKRRAQLYNSFELILNPEIAQEKAEKKVKEKTAKAIAAAQEAALAAKKAKAAAKAQSAYHMTNVDKKDLVQKVKFGAVKKGQPITWGACLYWVDKGSPGATYQVGETYYLHPNFTAKAPVKAPFLKGE
jgi:hypothetical protein